MSENPQSEASRTALQVACDTEVSGCVFLMRTEEDDRDRLLQITRDHVAEQHGQGVQPRGDRRATRDRSLGGGGRELSMSLDRATADGHAVDRE